MRKLVYTDFIVLFTQCSPYSLGGRLFLCSCELSRKDIVSKYISLKCPFEHKNNLIQGSFVMAPCKRQVKATRHLICNGCSNWVDFVKSGCEKSWAEVQADSFSFECRGCMRMKELEVDLEKLRLLVVAVVGRKQVGGASGSGGGTVDDKVGENDEREMLGRRGSDRGGEKESEGVCGGLNRRPTES